MNPFYIIFLVFTTRNTALDAFASDAFASDAFALMLLLRKFFISDFSDKIIKDSS